MICLRSLLVGILALFVSLYGLFLVFGLWMRLFRKSNTYHVVFRLFPRCGPPPFTAHPVSALIGT